MTRAPAIAVLALLAVLAASTAAASQSLSVEDRVHAQPIEPLGEPAMVPLNVTVACPENATGELRVSAEVVQAPAYANLTVAPAVAPVSEPCGPGETLEAQLPVRAVVTQHAPAFHPFKATVEAQARFHHAGSNDTTDLGNGTARLTLTPGYFNLYNVRLDQKIGQAGPQESVRYPIVIENFSNGPTRFEFKLVNPDSTPAGFQPVIPEPVILQSAATGGNTTNATVVFSVYTPFHNGYVNEVGAVQLQVDSFYAEDTSINGSSSQVSTITQARGWYVPGPGPLLVALGLVATALALRRARP